MTIPQSHITDSQGLIGDAEIEMYQIDLSGGSSLFLTPDYTRTWNGHTWDGCAIKLTGEGTFSNDQVAKPRLQIQNPDGLYSQLVSQGSLNKALVTRYRVLLSDLNDNVPIYVSNIWQVNRIASLNKLIVDAELRGLSDATNFIIPADTYQPPNYPAVTL